jgi:hypothetical protein
MMRNEMDYEVAVTPTKLSWKLRFDIVHFNIAFLILFYASE